MPPLAVAQSGATANAPAAAQAAAADDPDLDFSIDQPDFTLITLPTTLRMPRFKSAFRVTHRFGRSLGSGDFADLAGDLFGLDSGAQIGLEYKFGVMRGLQAGIHRTSNKTIEFFGQYSVCRRADRRSVWASSRLSTARTTSAMSIHQPRRGCVADARRTRRAVLRADLGRQQQYGTGRGGHRQRYRHAWRGRAASRPSDGLSRRRNHSARVGLRPRRDARIVRASKSARAATRSS